ncbi:P-loop containing nucleoside triphosphate hydrolase protein [Auriculariales sp. MPI-PUGE-AT-0066]|nr:P-loop containing nucleoside triphosphate hydrolase protein [Auriculariales sp. MPI-PUGE-AT-0066]
MPFSRPSSSTQTVRVLVVGDDAVGKSALVESLVSGVFSEAPVHPTMFNSWTHPMVVDTRPVTLSIWEPSTRLPHDLTRKAYQGKDVVMFCHDVDRPDTLQNVYEKWMPQVFDVLPDTPFALVGCKNDEQADKCSDLSTDSDGAKGKSVLPTHIRAKNAHMALSCSAKAASSVRKVFEVVVRLNAQRHSRRRSA